MAGMNNRTIVTSAVLVLLIVAGLYILDPTLGGFLSSREGFAETMGADANYSQGSPPGAEDGPKRKQATETNPNNSNATESFADLAEGPASFGDSQAPAGCYPRDQLTPAELLPKDPNSVWAQQNPMGSGSLKGKNFLSAGALIGVNTVGQSLRNANWQLRSEPPNPQVPVSVFMQSTIAPDANRRNLEIN